MEDGRGGEKGEGAHRRQRGNATGVVGRKRRRTRWSSRGGEEADADEHIRRGIRVAVIHREVSFRPCLDVGFVLSRRFSAALFLSLPIPFFTLLEFVCPSVCESICESVGRYNTLKHSYCVRIWYQLNFLLLAGC